MGRQMEEEVSDDEVAIADLEFDEATMALLDRARNVLETPGINPVLTDQLVEAIDTLYSAVQSGNEEETQLASDALIDLLVEAEE
jgi:hypothetical protein